MFFLFFAVKRECLARCEAFKKQQKFNKEIANMKKAMSKLGKWLWNLHHICTIIVVAELVIATGLYLHYTKNFLDPVTTAGMNVVPTDCPRAAAISSDKADTASASADSFAACLNNYSASKRRAEGKRSVSVFEAIAYCCDTGKLSNAELGECARQVLAGSQ